MRSVSVTAALLLGLAVATGQEAAESNGLAPEVTDLNAKDISYGKEKKIPYLNQPFIDTAPNDLADGILVGELGRDGGNKEMILRFAQEVAAGTHGDIDSVLLFHKGKLLFESYYRRGRLNYPHYQMSIAKSITAMAIGRAIQLGHLSTADLDRPVVSFLKDIDRTKLALGAADIRLSEAMNMRSGVRLGKEKAKELMKQRNRLRGQGQVQMYLQHSAPITEESKAFKYQASDPTMTMQVLEAVVPGSARDFIKAEVFGRMGITNYAWQNDVSGLPKAAAGCCLRSRDMLKWGMLIMNGGRWNGQQLIPEAFIERATGRIHTNKQKASYGYFWWRADMQVGDKAYDCKSGRGANGQYILMLPELELIVVFTAHTKGMGKTLKTTPERILPAFIRE
jgi:CubicO group peptidase (beta-lactamase class C family)